MDVARRNPVRLPGIESAPPGAHFVTITVVDRICLLGAVRNAAIELNALGAIVERCWRAMPQRFPTVELDAFVVMPNHLHALLAIVRPGGAVLPAIIGTFKSESMRAANAHRRVSGVPLWDHGYQERLVRDAAERDRLRRSIDEDPACWEQDEHHPARYRR